MTRVWPIKTPRCKSWPCCLLGNNTVNMEERRQSNFIVIHSSPPTICMFLYRLFSCLFLVERWALRGCSPPGMCSVFLIILLHSFISRVTGIAAAFKDVVVCRRHTTCLPEIKGIIPFNHMRSPRYREMHLSGHYRYHREHNQMYGWMEDVFGGARY